MVQESEGAFGFNLENKLKNQGRNAIHLVGIYTGGRPDLQLGKVHPQFKSSRPSIHSNLTHLSPRRGQSEMSLTEPLQTRYQTLLSYSLNADARRQLATGITSRRNEGRRSKDSLTFPIDL